MQPAPISNLLNTIAQHINSFAKKYVKKSLRGSLLCIDII
jgi:hypothetical protein